MVWQSADTVLKEHQPMVRRTDLRNVNTSNVSIAPKQVVYRADEGKSDVTR